MNLLSLQSTVVPFLLAAALSAAADPQTEAAGAYRVHKAAIVNGDLQAAMEGLSEDVTYVAGPACPSSNPCKGKEAARKNFVAGAIDQKMRITPAATSEPGEEAGSVRTRVEVSWPGIEKLGLHRIVGIDTVKMQQGKIHSLIFMPDLTDEQTAKLYSMPPPAK